MAVRTAPAARAESDESGQAVIEYILLLSTVVTVWMTIMSWINSSGLAGKLVKPITGDYARAYQFGDIKAKGFDEGAPERHPRARGCEGCFRIFINPGEAQ